MSLGAGRIPNFVRLQGCEARTKVEQFGTRRVPDDEWIGWCGSDWIALTKDEAIRVRQQELMATKRSKVRMFSYMNQQLTGEEMVQYLERHWAKIVQHSLEPGPFIFGIYSDRLSRLPPIRPR